VGREGYGNWRREELKKKEVRGGGRDIKRGGVE